MRDVILVRTDLPKFLVSFSNPQSANYANYISVPTGSTYGAIDFKRGWTSVDIKILGHPVARFVNTHLESAASGYRQLQAGELVGPTGPLTNPNLAAILVGDLNSDPSIPFGGNPASPVVRRRRLQHHRERRVRRLGQHDQHVRSQRDRERVPVERVRRADRPRPDASRLRPPDEQDRRHRSGQPDSGRPVAVGSRRPDRRHRLAPRRRRRWCGAPDRGPRSFCAPAQAEITNPDRDLYISGYGTRLHGAPSHRPRRIADEPRGRRERPGPHHPDPRARVRRLRHRGREVPRRADARDRVHRLPPQAGRLRPAPGRRPDDPREAAVRRHHAGADGDVRRRHRAATRRSTRATSRRGRTSRSTTSRCDDEAKLIREISDVRPLRSARAAATPSATSPATRWAGVCEDEIFDPTPYVGAYVRYFVRHPTTQLMPRKVKTAFDGTDERPRDHRHPRHRLPRARARRRARASRCASAAARRSCRASPRRSYDFVARRRRRVPEDRRGRASASSTARTGCA